MIQLQVLNNGAWVIAQNGLWQIMASYNGNNILISYMGLQYTIGKNARFVEKIEIDNVSYYKIISLVLA